MQRLMVDPPWEELAHDIWSSIFPRLSLVDRVRASVVCKQWRSALKQTPRPVWLLYQLEEKGADLYYFDMDDGATTRKLNHLKCNFLASSKGWLLQKTGTDLLLVDPISRVQIPLPRFAWLDLTEIEISSEDASQAVVARIALRDGFGYLALCKPGDKRWTTFDWSGISSILFYNGILYALVNDCTAAPLQIQTHSIKLSGNHVVTLKLIFFPVLYLLNLLEERDTLWSVKLSLVESNGELLIVLKKPHELFQFKYSIQDTTFQVLKLEARDDKPCLTRLSNLDDHTLFIDKAGKRSLRHESSRKNCIYFLEDVFVDLEEGGDMITLCGIFHLNDGRVEPFLSKVDNVKWHPFSNWFFPNIKIGLGLHY